MATRRQVVSLSWMDRRIAFCQVHVAIEGHYEISRQQVQYGGALGMKKMNRVSFKLEVIAVHREDV